MKQTAPRKYLWNNFYKGWKNLHDCILYFISYTKMEDVKKVLEYWFSFKSRSLPVWNQIDHYQKNALNSMLPSPPLLICIKGRGGNTRIHASTIRAGD